MIAVVHAYSRRNAGDGLLVDLTLDRLLRAGVPPERCEVFALDAASFSDLERVYQVGVPGNVPSVRAVAQLAAAGLDGASGGRVLAGDVARRIHEADAVVGLAGGYLRTGSALSSFGTLLNHAPQLLVAARTNAPTIYMPQSIGPLRGPAGSLVRKALARLDVVCVRDDVSFRELSPDVATHRFPDLAVLHLAENLDDTAGAHSEGPVILVGRDLALKGDYRLRLKRLSDRLAPVVWAVQAASVGKKSDEVFYEALGVRSAGRLFDVLSHESPSVVVSVRLHGALQALLAGVPAIHLSYQRKGWSAYADLGLDEFVHDAERFDPELVAAQVSALRADPQAYWARVSEKRSGLLESSEALTDLVARTLKAVGH